MSALPRTVDEVSRIVRACAEARVGIVPYGGGTGLVGGQVMPEGAEAPLILSLERMNAMRGVWPEENVLIAEAGRDPRGCAGRGARGGAALSAVAGVRRLGPDRRAPGDECGRGQRAALRQCARSVSRARGGAARRADLARPQAAAEGQYRLRSAQPADRGGGHAWHHHGGEPASSCRCPRRTGTALLVGRKPGRRARSCWRWRAARWARR